MEDQGLLSRYYPVIRKNWLPLALGLLGLIFFIYGLISLFSSSSSSKDTAFQPQESFEKAPIRTISVDVEGAVIKPGVYNLPENSRLQDALVAASGLSSDADRDYISKNLNLASKLSDSAKIYIPKVGDINQNTEVLGTSIQDTQSGLININSASANSLDTLPGIGPVTASKIINNRPYSSIDDLLSKKLVSNKVFNEIKDKITAY